MSTKHVAIALGAIYWAYLIGLWLFYIPQSIDFFAGGKSSGYILLGLLAADGLPIYLPLDSTARISILYGPTAFLPLGWFASAFSSPTAGVYFYGVFRGIIAYFLFAGAIWRLSGKQNFFTLIAVTILSLIISDYGWRFEEKGMLLFGLCIFCLGISFSSLSAQLFFTVGGMFLAFNAQATAPLYFLPLFLLWKQYNEWRGNKNSYPVFLFALVLTATATALLFALHPSFNPINYWKILTAVGVGREWSAFRTAKNIVALFFSILPMLVILRMMKPKDGNISIIVTLGCALPVVFYIAAISGANINHVHPYAVVSWAFAAFWLNNTETTAPLKISKKIINILLLIFLFAAVVLGENFFRRKITPLKTQTINSEAKNEANILRHTLSGNFIYAPGSCDWLWKCSQLAMGKIFYWQALLYGEKYRHFYDPIFGDALDDALYRSGEKAPDNFSSLLESEEIEVFVLPLPATNTVKKINKESNTRAFIEHYEPCGDMQFFALFCAKSKKIPTFELPPPRPTKRAASLM